MRTSAPAGGQSRSWLYPLALCTVSLPVFFFGLGDYGVVNGDEAFYHYVARQMTRSGNWFQLVFTGEHRAYDTFMNAPWQYWARAVIILIIGDNYWSMRLLSATSGLLTVLMTYRLTAWLADRRAGTLAGLVQLTTMQFVHLHSARTGELDAVLAFLFTAIAYLFLRALETGRGFVRHHLCLALLIGIKLPVILMPLAAEGAFFALSASARRRWRDWALSALWVLPLGLLWHVGNALIGWEDFLAAMAKMRGEAAAGSEVTIAGRLVANARFYSEVLAFGTYPWVALYPFAIWSSLRSGTREQRERWGLVLLFAAAVLVFFLHVGRSNPWYILPAYPFLSAVTGVWLVRLLRERPRTTLLIATSLALALVVSIQVEINDLNPYAKNAWRIPMEVSWRDLAGLGPTAAVAATTTAFLISLLGLNRVARGDPRVTGGVVLVLLLTLAGWRTVRPLAFTNTQSEMERVCRAMRDAPQAVRLPVRIHEPGNLKVRFYFGDHYRIMFVGGTRGIWYVLHPLDGQAPWGNPSSASNQGESGGLSCGSSRRASEAVRRLALHRRDDLFWRERRRPGVADGR